MKKQAVILSLVILFVSELVLAKSISTHQTKETSQSQQANVADIKRQLATAVKNARSRIQYLSQTGTSDQSIQSIQNIERKILAEYKISSAANMLYKRNRNQESQSHLHQTQSQFKKTTSLYNKVLRQHLNPQQVTSYMNYLKQSQELIHIPGGFYSPYVLSSFIIL